VALELTGSAGRGQRAPRAPPRRPRTRTAPQLNFGVRQLTHTTVRRDCESYCTHRARCGRGAPGRQRDAGSGDPTHLPSDRWIWGSAVLSRCSGSCASGPGAPAVLRRPRGQFDSVRTSAGAGRRSRSGWPPSSSGPTPSGTGTPARRRRHLGSRRGGRVPRGLVPRSGHRPTRCAPTATRSARAGGSGREPRGGPAGRGGGACPWATRAWSRGAPNVALQWTGYAGTRLAHPAAAVVSWRQRARVAPPLNLGVRPLHPPAYG
jgi:hypothetical protein